MCKEIEFWFHSDSVMNSLNWKSKSLSQCLTELFPMYQNKHWIIRQPDDCSVNPSSNCIMLKIVGFQMSNNFFNRAGAEPLLFPQIRTLFLVWFGQLSSVDMTDWSKTQNWIYGWSYDIQNSRKISTSTL